MRQIVLDTETTGIGVELGHRIIEIGCIELVDRTLTGKHFHTYLNPQREVDAGAFRVHGISTEFLKDKPLFKDIADEFIEFVRGAELIIHNAPFDVGFLNAELMRAKRSTPITESCSVCDTLVLAKEKHPGQRNNLDALCKRYSVDNSNRTFHGALLDAEILAFVYLAMTGGQANLFEDPEQATQSVSASIAVSLPLEGASVVIEASTEELQRHNEFIEFLIKKSGQFLWDSDAIAKVE